MIILLSPGPCPHKTHTANKHTSIQAKRSAFRTGTLPGVTQLYQVAEKPGWRIVAAGLSRQEPNVFSEWWRRKAAATSFFSNLLCGNFRLHFPLAGAERSSALQHAILARVMPTSKRHFAPGDLQFLTSSTYRRAKLSESDRFRWPQSCALRQPA
jgi:hypothetical protein